MFSVHSKQECTEKCTYSVLLNSKYKRTFVLIKRNSFLAKEMFDFVNHSPVSSQIYCLLFFWYAPFYKSGSQIMRHERNWEHHATSLLLQLHLVYCAYFQLYMRFITYTINSMFCQISGFMSCLDQIIVITFKLSSYRKKVSANEILESFFRDSRFEYASRFEIQYLYLLIKSYKNVRILYHTDTNLFLIQTPLQTLS